MNIRQNIVALGMVVGVAAPVALSAGEGTDLIGGEQPNWGTDGNIVYTIAAPGFEPPLSSSSFATNSHQYKYSNDGAAFFAPLPLPAGALVVGLELEACDDDATGQVSGSVLVCPHRGDHSCTNHGWVYTGSTLADTPGCDGFFAFVNPPLTVDNLVNTYLVEVHPWPGIGNRFLSVLVSYKLQISPAPGSPTFPDVSPTFWAFREIEALAASGITQGFPDGTFRPTEPVTRAQMATFLARALGLHWPY
jgi:hypothetical protein